VRTSGPTPRPEPPPSSSRCYSAGPAAGNDPE
jgi:hypothetical protein